MGLGNDDDVSIDDGDGGSCAYGCRSKYVGPVSCSICLEVVSDNGNRSWAKLQCGHQFHLDCIGSAFNIKGAMQCPNCRKIEKGQWLYANGFRSIPEASIEERMHDEDLYDLSYSEMSFGVHWCPFGSLSRIPSSFEEPEFSNTTYHNLVGQHAIFSEHAAVSSPPHPCPYVAYFGPIHPSSSNSSASVLEAPNFNTRWNAPSVPNEIPASFAFPPVDLPYRNWDHHPSTFAANSGRVGADQPSILPVTQRSATRPGLEMSRSRPLVHPFLVNHSSGVRAGSSVTSSMIPPYPGSNARARDRVQALEAYNHQLSPTTMRTPPMPGSRRPSSHRPLPSSTDQSPGFYFFPSAASVGGNLQEPQNPLAGRFHHPQDIDYSATFSPNHQVERDSGSWGEPHHARQRHGLERTSSTHYRS